MWGSWGIALFLVAAVLSVFAFAGWMVAVPLAVIGAGAILWVRAYGRRRGAEDVSWLRDQAAAAGPLDKGGVDFTDRDRETLSS